MARKKAGSARSTTKKRKPRQAALPGVADEVHKIPAVQTAAREYLEHRKTFQEAVKEFKDSNTKLIELMAKHNLPDYRSEDLLVIVTHKDNVRVREVGDDGGDVDPEAIEREIEATA